MSNNEEQVAKPEVEKKTTSPRTKTTSAGNTTPTSTTDLGIYKIESDAVMPEFKTEQSACFDLSSYLKEGDEIAVISHTGVTTRRRVNDRGLLLTHGQRALIPTKLVFDIPEGYCMEIYPRSGISYKNGITLSNCTAIIDSDYVEEVFVSIINNGESQYIAHNDRIAQSKIVKLEETNIKTLSSQPKKKSSRSGGFGSTGK